MTVSSEAAVPGSAGGARQQHVFEAQRAGMPNPRVYLEELWRRRQFVVEMARSTLKAQNYTTLFGQLWLVLNPLLTGFVYYLLVDILSGGKHAATYFPQLLAGLFLFNFLAGCMSQGAGSVIGSSRLIMNSSFPRLLLPITQIVIAFFRFLPSLLVFFVVHFVKHEHFTWASWLAVPAFVCVALFASGLSFICATAQVYFRDFANVLPYLTRIWLFLSPVLWQLETQLNRSGPKAELIAMNPLSPMLGMWGDALVEGKAGRPEWLLQGACWGIGTFLLGTVLFMWREREFSVRL
ncbi:hypothetical protein BIV57_13905 [Mangrovactinospora gilvigrisea]|uniref:ABC-2 type transporter transmembrane domain-containing protein n=1 Tax=Mangrovactinospora gilvigrisea TaxID=1428644 RepID=A0A1J7C5N6_9ACTN|nr:ABC transporter permease [Mangrovactinospora gilvigrisea]OIV36856.1 hypothetical protein BIV57_13905 [Mangrovactinospora gilvigrisea]